MRFGSILLIVGGLVVTILVGLALGSFSLGTTVLFLAAGLGVLVTLYNPRIGLYIMFVIIPLQNLVIFESGSTLVRLVGIVVFIAWVLNRILRKDTPQTLFAKPILPPMAAFFILVFVASFWSKSNLWQETMFTYAQLGAWAIMLMDMVDSFENLERALFWVFIGSLAGAILSVYEFNTQTVAWQYGQRGRGGFDDPNYSSAMFMFIMPYVFHRMRYDRGLHKLGWAAGAIILLTGVAYTVSRTGLLSIFLLLAGQFVMYSKAQTRVKYILLVIFLLLITAPLWPWGNIAYRFSIAWTGGSEQDLGQRVSIMRLGWNLFSRNPILGQGLGYPPGQDVIHNIFLSLAVQLGIFGLAAISWLWLTTWNSLTTARRRAAAFLEERQVNLVSSMQLTVLIYLFFSLSLATEAYRPLWLLFALGGICYAIVPGKGTVVSSQTSRAATDLTSPQDSLAVK